MTVAEVDVPPAQLTTSMVLTRGLEILNATGWCKELYSDGKGRHCMAGAIFAQQPEDEAKYRAIAALTDAVEEVTSFGYSSVSTYNDLASTTWEDVQHIYNQAIKATTPKENPENGTS